MTTTVGATDYSVEGETKNINRPKGLSSHFDDEVKVPLSSLSEMTGFPVEFIKSELLLQGEELSMAELRSSMVNYLESNNSTSL